MRFFQVKPCMLSRAHSAGHWCIRDHIYDSVVNTVHGATGVASATLVAKFLVSWYMNYVYGMGPNLLPGHWVLIFPLVYQSLLSLWTICQVDANLLHMDRKDGVQSPQGLNCKLLLHLEIHHLDKTVLNMSPWQKMVEPLNPWSRHPKQTIRSCLVAQSVIRLFIMDCSHQVSLSMGYP